MNRRSFLTSSSLVIGGLSLSSFVSATYAAETSNRKRIFNRVKDSAYIYHRKVTKYVFIHIKGLTLFSVWLNIVVGV